MFDLKLILRGLSDTEPFKKNNGTRFYDCRKAREKQF